jgi:hypothetical protein
MALRKNAKYQSGTLTFQVPTDSDLSSRIERISAQTGLNTADLFQKWVLQEESLIGLMQHGESPIAEPKQNETRPDTSTQQLLGVQEQKETLEVNPDSPNYRKELVKRIKKLKEERMPLIKIAQLFNEENVQTISGKGKWYSSSITNLLNSKV